MSGRLEVPSASAGGQAGAVASARVSGGYRGKRLLDLACVVLLAIPVSLISAICAVAVRLDSKGTALFRQERVGLQGRPFTILKFRSMMTGLNPMYPEADRITSVGKWLRRLSLDELPQLWNVARGDMSIVGPRPTLSYQVERYTARQRQRLCVRPGITGLAQVRGRNGLSWPERIELDLEYIRRQSLWLDLAIMLESVTAVIKGQGVEGHLRDDPLGRVDDPT